MTNKPFNKMFPEKNQVLLPIPLPSRPLYHPIRTIFANGIDPDDDGIAAAIMDLPVYFEDRIYYPGEDLLISRKHLSFRRKGLVAVVPNSDHFMLSLIYHPAVDDIKRYRAGEAIKLSPETRRAVPFEMPQFSWFKGSIDDSLDGRSVVFDRNTSVFDQERQQAIY